MGFLTVGDEVPADVTLPGMDGDDVLFSELRGKRAILFMWGSW